MRNGTVCKRESRRLRPDPAHPERSPPLPVARAAIAVVDPTQNALPPLPLEFDDNHDKHDETRDGDDLARERTVQTSGGPPNQLVSRSMEAVVKWEEGRTREGAEAALAATGRLLAGDSLSIEAMHLKGVALHMLGRWAWHIILRSADTIHHHVGICFPPTISR